MAFGVDIVLAFFLDMMKQLWCLFTNLVEKPEPATHGTAVLDEIQINIQLCKRLERKLVKARKDVDRVQRGNSSDVQEKVLQELNTVIKRAHDLRKRCMCKKTIVLSHWLFAAVTLLDIQEDVLEIELDLAWWRTMLEISTVAVENPTSPEDDNDVTQTLEQLKTCYDKLSKEGKSLQKAASKDKEHLLLKLEEERSKHAVGTEKHLLSVYLLSRLKELKGDSVPHADTAFLDQHFQSNLKKIRHLGNGSFGRVYKVTWLSLLNLGLAMKEIDNNVKAGMPVPEKLKREGKFLKFSNHPHIVRFIWSWEQQKEDKKKSPHILMELMPTNLQSLIEKESEGGARPPFTWDVAIDIMLQIAKAMRYLHGKRVNLDGKKSNITHRDLKPANILVEPCGSRAGFWNVKLADFGISKVYRGTETTSTQTAKQGTKVYAAPEVFLPREETSEPKFPPKADVWSFAVTCSQILTGNSPFKGLPSVGLHDRIKEDEIRPDLPLNLPVYVHYCITSCWDCFPDQRPNFQNICRMLSLAKAMNLGILPLDSRTKPLLSSGHPVWQIARPCPAPHPDEILEFNSPTDGETYFLVGTKVRYYYNELMKEELFNDAASDQNTGIGRNPSQYKCLNPVRKPIMQGGCWSITLRRFAYGCLSGYFVNSKYQSKLREMNLKVVTGGFVGETDTRSVQPEVFKDFWGDKTEDSTDARAAEFYRLGESDKRYIYVWIRYGSSNGAVISHLWHNDLLVLGDKITATSARTRRVMVGSKILITFNREQHVSYTLALATSATVNAEKFMIAGDDTRQK